MRPFLDSLDVFDTAACRKIFRIHGIKSLDRLMWILSFIGNGYIFAITGIIILAFDPDTAIVLIPVGLIGHGLGLITNAALKTIIRRSRPFENMKDIEYHLPPQDKFSFPSGHACASFLLATLLLHFYPLFAIPAYVIAILIGFSRIYNGVHYPSDVVAGTIIGILCARIALALLI